MLHLRQKMGLHQKMTPQQVQYLKLLQTPAAELEAKIKEELDDNPLLEEVSEDEQQQAEQNEITIPIAQSSEQAIVESGVPATEEVERSNDYTLEDFMNDETEGFKAPRISRSEDEEEREDRFQQAAEESFTESLSSQLSLLELSPRMRVLAEEIIGSLDEDGYLREPLDQIVHDTNVYFGEEYTQIESERLLRRIQKLDPIGVAARNLQECLMVQLEAIHEHSPARELAIEILRDHYEHFVKKNYQILAKKLRMEVHDLKPAIDLIQHLNPKPGAPSRPASENTRYITPDFYIEKTPDGKDFVITLNERGIPTLRVNSSYKELAKKHGSNGTKALPNDAREFINKKFEAAKFFLQAIYQRRETLLRVMTSIVHRQHDFFISGEKFLKPMIYKTIAEEIGMDISTICRVVNGKYCQCDYGVFELKYFFSEAIPVDGGEGEAVSNKVVKARIKELIETENPAKPYNDDQLVELLRADSYDLARRTVAKYREQMNIPVARMRKRIM
ncbi:MAG: RNA polymerase factor sigma-54 [Bacteroidota bacterium]|nr:RNA polymerase factor sigma-54 [Bacteroidota bacterium]MDP4228838.1 RNA polymerase factor sigma-54 [Bacteroidota bacterium]